MDKDLQAIGLSANEITVYVSLLKIGETAVGGILSNTNLHRQSVYNALDGLEKRGLIRKAVKNGVAHFNIADPEILVENAKKQELAAKRLSQSIKQELKKSRREHEINVYNGQIGARRFFIQAFKNSPIGSTAYIMGVSVQGHVAALGEDFITGTYKKLRDERKIHSKLVMGETMREADEEYNKKTNPNLRETRYLPYENLNPISTIIWDDRVSFMSTHPDVFVVEIINKEFRDSYKDHFDILWKMAK